MLELRGVCWRLLGEHFGALGAALGPLGSARGSMFGAFGDVFGRYFGVSFSRAVVATIELYFAPSPNMFLRFSRLCKNGGHRSRLVNTSEFATCHLAF